MVHSASFIVLATTKVGDNSLVVHTLTPQWGRRSFITSAGKGGRMAMFLPLSLLEGEVMENPKSDLWRLRSAAVSNPLNGIRGNMKKNSMTLFMSEVLFRTITDGATEDGLYDWCRSSILTLDALESDFSNYHLLWLVQMAGALGFLPSTEDLAPFAGEHLGAVSRLLKSSPSEALLIPMNGAERNEIAALLLDYIGYHTETRLNIRSLQVLRELYR